jgi:fumarylacetoacetase
MIHDTNATHDPRLTSWVDAANDPHTDFPVQNLPFGVFARRGAGDAPRVGVAIGDRVVDVSAVRAAGLLADDARAAAAACAEPTMNALMSLPTDRVSALRRALGALLCTDGANAGAARARAGELLVPMAEAELGVPAAVGDYTDFYASIHHATNVGSMFRPDSPLLPNYKYVPIGYHGRASSIVASGTPVRRPRGQAKAADAAAPEFAPTRLLDYEAEVGMFVAGTNALGDAVGLDAAAERLFGLCLVNDWSARDVQAWEYQPLGPFLAKSFATTVSPWVVTAEALAPFRAPASRARRRPRAAAAPAVRARPGAGRRAHDDRGRARHRGDAGGRRARGAAQPRRVHGHVLDARPAAGAPREQRVQPAPRRPPRQRHRVGRRAGRARLPARAHVARRGAADPAGRRDPRLPRGR